MLPESGATRRVAACRHALAQSPSAVDVLTEAWQAQALAQAIGATLAVSGPAGLRAGARDLSHTAGRGGRVDDWDAAARATSAPRAAMLTGVSDPARTLRALAALLGEVGIALVAVACVTDDEHVYWQCIEAIDAADESSDRVRGLLRGLTVPEGEVRTRGPAAMESRE
ncbi:DUF6099 family protein [Streptomyces spororaveus]|uniref:DUF6099 family protein n=1 Tax=Streptomyces spororaveus TaxID=284039 RepID=UPI0036B46D74